MKDKVKKYFAEAIGSAIFLFCGIGMAIFGYQSFGVVGIACSFGLSYLFCYYTISKISGCHLNPLFSFSSMITKRISIKEFWFYVLSQFVGAIVACLLLLVVLLFCANATDYLTDFHACNSFGSLSMSKITAFGAILVEVIISCILVLVFMVCEFRKKKNNYSGIYIAIAYITLTFAGFYFTGACMNPIRAFCPALLILLFGNYIYLLEFFVFLIATFIGSLLGIIVFRMFYKEECEKLRVAFLNFGK